MATSLSRRRFAGLGGAAAASYLVNCAGVEESRPPETIRISAAAELSMSSLHLAQELGYFREAGLEVEIRHIPDPPQRLVLLAGGELDAGFTAFSAPVANAFLRGARLKLVAGREVASPDCGDFGAVYGTPETFPDGISDFRQLKGKLIATNRTAGIADFALEMELASVGLSIEDVELTILARTEGMAALLGGRVDGLVSIGVLGRGYPIVSRLVRSPALGSVLPNHQYSYVVFGKRLLEADPAVGAKFLAAYFRGTREFLLGETPQFMVQFARSNDMDEKAVREACRKTFSPDGKIDLESLRRYSDWAVKKGYCPTRLAPAEAVDEQYLDLAQHYSTNTS